MQINPLLTPKRPKMWVSVQTSSSNRYKSHMKWSMTLGPQKGSWKVKRIFIVECRKPLPRPPPLECHSLWFMPMSSASVCRLPHSGHRPLKWGQSPLPHQRSVQQVARSFRLQRKWFPSHIESTVIFGAMMEKEVYIQQGLKNQEVHGPQKGCHNQKVAPNSCNPNKQKCNKLFWTLGFFKRPRRTNSVKNCGFAFFQGDSECYHDEQVESITMRKINLSHHSLYYCHSQQVGAYTWKTTLYAYASLSFVNTQWGNCWRW